MSRLLLCCLCLPTLVACESGTWAHYHFHISENTADRFTPETPGPLMLVHPDGITPVAPSARAAAHSPWKFATTGGVGCLPDTASDRRQTAAASPIPAD